MPSELEDCDFDLEILMDCLDKGSELLSEHFAHDWMLSDDLNMADLNLANCQLCILGQLYGNYDRGLDWLQNAIEEEAGEEWEEEAESVMCNPEQYGFLDNANHSPEMLDVAWRLRIYKARILQGVS